MDNFDLRKYLAEGKLNEQLDLSSREYSAKKLFALIARDLKFSPRVQDNEMLDADEPYLLEVIVPFTEHVLPMIPQGKSAKEMLID